MKTSLVIADDHPLMLRGVENFLTSKDYVILGSANNGKSAYNLIIKEKPDIAILDIKMPQLTGLEIAEACQKNNLPTKIILLTFDKEESHYEKAKSYGVYGYILKEFAIEEIETCIAHAVMGEPYFCTEIAAFLKKDASVEKGNILDELTRSEKKIVSLIAEKKSSQQIAEELFVSLRTVEKHRSNIMKKLNLNPKPAALSIWVSLNQDKF